MASPPIPADCRDIHHIIYKKPTDDVASVTDLLCARACDDETKRENYRRRGRHVGGRLPAHARSPGTSFC